MKFQFCHHHSILLCYSKQQYKHYVLRLFYEKFHQESRERNSYPPKKIELFNRLVAHSKNFFAISAVGAFSPGYLLIITKKLISSFAVIENSELNEMKWFIGTMSKALEETYNRKSVLFEHGMCACIGGLDRAHLHLMTADKKVSNEMFLESINKEE